MSAAVDGSGSPHSTIRRRIDDATPTSGDTPKSRTQSIVDQYCGTEGKMMKLFATIFFMSLLAVTVTSLIVNFPRAGTAFYAVFSITGTISFVCLIISIVKLWQNGEKAKTLWTTASRAMQISAAILAISAVSILMTGLIQTYPGASTAIYAVFGIGVSASFIGIAVVSCKECKPDFMASKGDVMRMRAAARKPATNTTASATSVSGGGGGGGGGAYGNPFNTDGIN